MKRKFSKEARKDLGGVELLAKTPWQVWLLPITTILIVMGSFYMVLMPQVSGWFEMREEIQRSKETLERLESKRRALESLSEIELDRQFGIVDAALPGRTPMMEAIRSFVVLADETEVELSNYSLKPGSLATESAELEQVTPSGLTSLNLELSVSGLYEDVLLFVEKIESMAPIIHVSEAVYSMQNTDEEGRELPPEAERDVSVSLDISIYYARPVRLSVSATSPLPNLSAKQTGVIEKASRLERVDATDLLEAELPPIVQEREDVFRF